MFENACRNDKVWDFVYGWGKVDKVNLTNEELHVIFGNNDIEVVYDLNGKQNYAVNQTLFWDKLKFDIPEKPFDLENELRKLEIKEFDVYEDNYTLGWDNSSNKISKNFYNITETPMMKYFTEESIDKFINNIKNKKITKEKFFSTYKKVFG